MRSMTGFGAAEHSDAQGRLQVQVSCVNNRRSQIQVRCEPRDLAVEEQIRQRVGAALGRGSVTVQIRWQAGAGAASDLSAVADQWRALKDLADRLGAPLPRLELVATVMSRATVAMAPEGVPTQVMELCDQALSACLLMRDREGDHLHAVVMAQLELLEGLCERMQEVAAGRLERYREQLLERMRAVLAERADIEEAHLLREMAVYADRLDITEEMDRLAGHIDHCRSLIGPSDARQELGKRLEFLLQEMLREVNTTGSKANDVDLSMLVVEAKAVLEQLREQAANIW